MLRVLACVLLLPWLCACTDLAALDGGADAETAAGGADRPALSDQEREIVRAQVDQAVAAKRFKIAWNQEVAAGADRERLEQIALAALEAQSGHAADMFEALRKKHAGLSNGARARVEGLVERATRAGAWPRALELELITADDPPAFSRAWAVYRAAPPERAVSLLESIQEAKEEASEKEAGD